MDSCCSVTVTFAIQQLHASIGRSLNQHIVMLQSMLEIGWSRGIWGNAKMGLQMNKLILPANYIAVKAPFVNAFLGYF